jgi:autotransporter-associated beta strand protein
LTNNGNFDLANFNQTVNALTGASTGIVKNSVAGTKTLTVGNGGGSGTFNGVIQANTGKIQLIKTGAGTQTLTSTNTYTGATLINEGTLVGVVGGSCVNSAVTNASAGTLAIGVVNDTNQWTCASLTLNNGSQLKFNFTGTPSPITAPLKILGDLTVVGTPTIEVVPSTSGTYPLLTITGAVPGTLPTLIGDIGNLQWIDKTLWVVPAAPAGTSMFAR